MNIMNERTKDSNIYASPDSGSTFLPVKSDSEGRIALISSLEVANAVSVFLPNQSLGSAETGSFSFGSPDIGSNWVIRDIGLVSETYADVEVKINVGGSFLHMIKTTATQYEAIRNFNGGLIVNGGSIIDLEVTNPLGVTASYHPYLTGDEVIP